MQGPDEVHDNTVDEGEQRRAELRNQIEQAVRATILEAIPYILSTGAELRVDEATLLEFLNTGGLTIVFSDEELIELGSKVWGLGNFPLTNKLLEKLGLDYFVVDLPIKYTDAALGFVQILKEDHHTGLKKMVMYLNKGYLSEGAGNKPIYSLSRVSSHEVVHIVEWFTNRQESMKNYTRMHSFLNISQEILTYAMIAGAVQLKPDSIVDIGILLCAMSLVFIFMELFENTILANMGDEKSANKISAELRSAFDENLDSL